jgi:hypothetical protein
MQPELTKQEGTPQSNPPRDEILQSLAKAYEQDIPDMEAIKEAPSSPETVSTDLSKVGSVGLEAGLTNFETKSADDSSSSDDDNDADEDKDAIPLVKPVAMTDIQPVSSPSTTVQPIIAEDRDEIEMQWVTKAKKIVEQTKSDPHLQERAVSKLQADYLKKRFNKDIKLPKEGNDGS